MKIAACVLARKTTLRGFITEAQNDAKDFVKETEEKLRRWTDMLAKGQITKLEFTALVDSQKGLANLDLLTHAGIAAATLQQFRDGLIDLIINAAFKTFL